MPTNSEMCTKDDECNEFFNELDILLRKDLTGKLNVHHTANSAVRVRVGVGERWGRL